MSTFTRRDWLGAAALAGGGFMVGAETADDSQAAPPAEAPGSLNVLYFMEAGDDGNGPAVRRAVEHLRTRGNNGGELFFPAGSYAFDGPLDFDATRGITLRGEGSPNLGSGAGTILRFTGTGDHFISARQSEGFGLEHLDIRYDNAAFTGHLVDLSSDANPDTRLATIRRCALVSEVPDGAGSDFVLLNSATSLVRLNGSHTMQFDGCSFRGASVAVSGLEFGSSRSANAIAFTSCIFDSGQSGNHVLNPGAGWAFFGCAFEQCADTRTEAGAPVANEGAGQARALACDTYAGALVFSGCWFGDNRSGGDWLRLRAHGIQVTGCYFGCDTATAIRLDADTLRGVVVQGNYFGAATEQPGNVAVEFGSTVGHEGVIVAGNSFANVQEVNGTLPAGLLRLRGDQTLEFGGRIVAADGFGVGNFDATPLPGGGKGRVPLYDTSGNQIGFIPVF